MSKLMGIGRVENGRILFASISGSGFSKPVSSTKGTKEKPSTRETKGLEAPKEIRKASTEKKQMELTVPDFMKDRGKSVSYEENVTYVDFRKEEEEVSFSDQAILQLVVLSKRILLPLRDYFFYIENEGGPSK